MNNMYKDCFICKKSKFLTEFYRHPGMADGFLGKCKDCAIKDSKTYNQTEKGKAVRKKHSQTENRKINRREYYKNHIEYYKAYRQTEQGKISHKKSSLKWKINNPEKRKASNAVYNALRDKRLFKKPCKECGNKEKVEGHHEDYNLPLIVVWLCRSCHILLHIEIKKKLLIEYFRSVLSDFKK